MKVVIAINTAWNIYNFRRGLIEALQERGVEVIAVSPQDAYAPLIESSIGCKYEPIAIENKGTNPFDDYQLYKRFLVVYKRLQPDVILHFTIKPNIYGTLAANKLGIPVINNVSGLGTVFLHNNPLYKVAHLLYRYAFKFPSKVFFQNSDDLSLFVNKGLVKKSITDVLPGSGVNIKEYCIAPYEKKEPFVFLMLARVLYDKGVEEYVRATQILKDKGYSVVSKIAGAMDETSKMGVEYDKIQNWHKKGLIEYLGEIQDIKKEIANCQCAVLPSYREGTPKSLLEAGALGRPVVTTNVPGCKDVVVDNSTGYLCEVRNPQSLAEKMEKMILHSEEELTRMGSNGRKLIETKFDERIVIQKYIDAIEAIK